MNSAMIRRRSTPVAVIAAVLAAQVAIPREAQAQDQRFDVQLFTPATSQRVNGLGQWGAHILGDLEFELGLLGHYSDDPLVLRTADGERVSSVVGHQATMDVLAGVGLFGLLELGLDVPLVLSQAGDLITARPNLDLDASDAAFGAGDIRLAAKLQLMDTDTPESPGGARFALVLEGFFPSGNADNFQGGDWRFRPTFVIEGVARNRTRLLMNLGWTFRNKATFGDLEVNDSANWGLTAIFEPATEVQIVPEVRGAVAFLAKDFGPEEVPIEADLALRIRPIEQLQFTVGGGAGLFQGFGAPDYRVMLGVSWLQTPAGDRDGDGIMNPDDSCPDEPEDFDDFEDVEGCPDPDNDQDGILDEPDQCPLEPEDIDQFEDENGCPDPDNDQDNILDESDECPNEAEDVDGFEDENGCPDPDNDQDGILDEPDQCPLDPEDMNGVEDEDGCPEVDSDGDGLLDPRDRCPREPEDMDQFEDEDGCPDPDNDGDGILDEPDQCPNEPETMNGNEDEDGCPDESLVTVTCDRIGIADKVYFRTNSDEIMEVSHTLLNQVAGVLTSRPDIKRVRIEGHTDSRGNDNHNMDLSRRRAASVRTYLLARGIDAARLESEGYGETRPVDSNRTSAGRAANRRVDFVILEIEGCTDENANRGGAAPATPAAVP